VRRCERVGEGRELVRTIGKAGEERGRAGEQD
jgi:hypothetical protein